MRKYDYLIGLLTGTLTVAVLLCSSGCPKNNTGNHHDGTFSPHDYDPNFPHNLARVKCRKQTDNKPVKINLVATDQVLNDPLDRVVFVCKGDTVIWQVSGSKLKFTVDFKDKSKVKDLFDLGGGTFKHDPSIPNPPPVEAPKQLVKSLLQDQLVDYEYSIDICCDEDGKAHHIDPHIIPMGK
jgi:hypothetical protein